jgi:O-antigen/teichoic acid export membrane protein
MSGTMIAQIITFAFMPILTRLYSPSEFGVYAVFIAVVGIFGSISSLKYDQAIMLPKSDRDAKALIFLSIIMTFGMGVFTIIIVSSFYYYIVDYFQGVWYVVWMIPLSVILIGLVQIFNAYFSRQQAYKQISILRVVNSCVLVGTQTGFGSLFKFNGLMIGKLLSDAFTLVILVRIYVKKQSLQLRSISRRRMIVNARRYDNFPKYQSLTVFLNSMSQSLPIFLFSSLYSAEMAGFYALSVQILQAPISLIGASTREVYYQRASRMYVEGKDIFNLYWKTTLGLFKIFIIPFLIIFLFGDNIFSILFGNNWTQAGSMSQILIFWFLFLFINTPSIVTFNILHLQKIQLNLEIVSILLRFLSIYIGWYFFNDQVISLVFFTIMSIAINFFAIGFIYYKLKHKVIVQ